GWARHGRSIPAATAGVRSSHFLPFACSTRRLRCSLQELYTQPTKCIPFSRRPPPPARHHLLAERGLRPRPPGRGHARGPGRGECRPRLGPLTQVPDALPVLVDRYLNQKVMCPFLWGGASVAGVAGPSAARPAIRSG